MMRFPAAITFAMLAFNLMMEYGTLTSRRRLASHIVARCLALALAFAILGAWDSLGLGGPSLLRACASTFFFYLACLYLFEESFAQKTFLFFMDFSATVFLMEICSWLSSRLAPGEGGTTLEVALFVGSLVVLVPLYFRFLRGRVREMLFLFKQGKPSYAAFPFLSFAYLILAFGAPQAASSPFWFGRMMLFVVVIVLVYYLLFSHFYSAYAFLKAEQDLVRAERQLSMQKRYYEEMEKGIKAQRELVHDARHHLVAISSLAKTGEAAAIERYIERLLESYGSAGTRDYCENDVANAVIGGYVKMAESKGIVVATDLDLPRDLGIDDYEICALFGNTIQNAIDACERIPAQAALRDRRRIEIRSRARGSRLVVDIENSFMDEPGGEGAAKPSSAGSGIGLESVRRVVESREGTMSCDRRGSTFVFSASLELRGPEPGPRA